VPLRVTWGQVLAWRLERHLLDPLGDHPPETVVERLCGVQAQVPSSAELAVRLRSQASGDGAVAAALADGRLLRTWAMRGALHLLTPQLGAALLALIADGRPWQRPSWQRAFGMDAAGTAALRDAVAEVLSGRVLTREQLVSEVVARPGMAGLAAGLRSGWGTLLKPLAWQGELCHGPSQGTRATFMRPADASPAWQGLPTVDVAARLAVEAYVRAHGPATPVRFGRFLSGGFLGIRGLRRWFDELGDRLVEVDVDGERAWIWAEDAADVQAARASEVLRLLPGFDQWVLGPGSDDGHVVTPDRRALVSRTGGWISPVVIRGGRVVATWSLDADRIGVAWFAEAGRPPKRALEAEVARLGGILGRELRLAVERIPA
jgi:hypothetical protein